ncbi:MAG: hypothetical protein V1887_03975 [Candidatus Aenigmatarchaeota archaeon]
MQGNIPTLLYREDDERKYPGNGETLIIIGMTHDGKNFYHPPAKAVDLLQYFTDRPVIVPNESDFSAVFGGQLGKPNFSPHGDLKFVQVHPEGTADVDVNTVKFREIRAGKNRKPVIPAYTCGEKGTFADMD